MIGDIKDYIDFEKLYYDISDTWNYKTNPNSMKEYNAENYGLPMAKAIDFMNENKKAMIKVSSCRYDSVRKVAHLILIEINLLTGEDIDHKKHWIEYNFDDFLITNFLSYK